MTFPMTGSGFSAPSSSRKVILVYQLLLRFLVPKMSASLVTLSSGILPIWIWHPGGAADFTSCMSRAGTCGFPCPTGESGSWRASYGWGGFGNYAKMFSSPDFWPSLRNTLLLFCA